MALQSLIINRSNATIDCVQTRLDLSFCQSQMKAILGRKIGYSRRPTPTIELKLKRPERRRVQIV